MERGGKEREKKKKTAGAGKQSVLDVARTALTKEAEAVAALIPRIGEQFEQAVDLLCQCKGRVIVTGVGKSGIVGTKLAATLRSTGTPAFYLHAGEGIHGDLGLVSQDDVVIALSKSGETDELRQLVPSLKMIGVPIIALTGNLSSLLAARADVVIDVSVQEEACPFDLAPTSSTTAAMAMCDALAVALVHRNEFKPEQFAHLHPGGSLGKSLSAKVEDFMLTGTYVPSVSVGSDMKEAVLEMTAKRGITTVLDNEGKLVGVITDGDLRRLLEKTEDLFSLKVREVMTRNPKVISRSEPVHRAFHLMRDYGITALIVVNGARVPTGIVHLHDLMRAGVV